MAIIHLKSREAPKSVRSSMETLLFSRAEVDGWKVPNFQRPIRVNAKVQALAEELKHNGGMIPGIVTLGRIVGDKTNYLVDGQHRAEAFKISELPECIADVRIVTFDSMAEMAEEFVELNGRLVNMRPDDILRALSEQTPELKRITRACEFVSYGQVRRSGSTALMSMSTLLRCWHMSSPEVPVSTTPSATALAQTLDSNEADKIIAFMQIARGAWGIDPENYRLWGNLNMVITMWLWRRLVIERDVHVKRNANRRAVSLTPTQFGKCLMSVSADSGYLDWLVGRNLTERDRSPCFIRIKQIFAKRIEQDSGSKPLLPSPQWASR